MSQCSQQDAFDDGGQDKPADGVMGDVQTILLNHQQNVVQDNTAAANAVEFPTKGLFLRSKIETESGYQDESLPEVRLVQVLNLASDISPESSNWSERLPPVSWTVWSMSQPYAQMKKSILLKIYFLMEIFRKRRSSSSGSTCRDCLLETSHRNCLKRKQTASCVG